jgi:hypothetical protein
MDAKLIILFTSVIIISFHKTVQRFYEEKIHAK